MALCKKASANSKTVSTLQPNNKPMAPPMSPKKYITTNNYGMGTVSGLKHEAGMMLKTAIT